MVMMKKTVHLQRTEKSSRAQSQNDFTRCCLLLSRCKLAADKRDGSPRHSQFSLGHYIHTFPGWGGGWGDVGGLGRHHQGISDFPLFCCRMLRTLQACSSSFHPLNTFGFGFNTKPDQPII